MRLALASLIVYLWASSPAFAAELVFSPESGTTASDAVFDISIVVSSDEPVTAAEATISFDPDALEIESIDTASSLVVAWPTQPFFSNDRGILKFSGSFDAPYSGERGAILTIRARGKSVGTHELRFDDAAILGTNGSNVISSLSSGIYRIDAVRRATEIAEDPLPLAEAPQIPAVSPPVPLFDAAKDLELGDRLVVSGFVVPDALVRLTIREGEGEPTEHVVPSAADGSFTFVSDFRVRENVYRVSAVTEKNGARSEPSQTVAYTVRSLGLAAAAATAVELMTFVLPLMALTVLLGAVIAFIIHRRRAAIVR